jgi:hypothetical protein
MYEYRTVLLPHSITIHPLSNPSQIATECKCAPSHTPAITCRVAISIAMFETVMDSARDNTGTEARF